MPARSSIAVAALLFGTTGTAQALARLASPVSVGAARIVLGGGVLALIALLRGELRGLSRSVLAGAIGVAAYQLAFFAAVEATGVAVGTVVTIGSAAILTGVLERIVEGTRLDARWAAATACAVAGVALLAAAPGAHADPIGVALALAAAAGYAGYAVTSKRMLRQGARPVGVMGGTFGLAALLLVPVLALTHPAWVVSARGAALTAYLALVPTVAAYLFFVQGLRRLRAADVATIGLLEPITAAALGVLALHEPMRAMTAAGSALVLAGLVVLTLRLPGRGAAAPVPVET